MMGIDVATILQLQFVTVISAWFVFGLIFLLRKRPPKAEERKRDRKALVGIALQASGYSIVWMSRRPLNEPFLSSSPPLNLVLFALAVFLVVGSIWMIAAAVRVLGKQWSLAARLIEGHALITSGPYKFVRHPIYSGMLGMLVATGLAVSAWVAVVIAVTIFVGGTIVRARREEILLRTAFGQEYDDYARKVPALIPFLNGF